MKRTLFAGLTLLDPEEPLSLDDFSFQAENPESIDRLLEVGAVTHRHDAHAALGNPSVAPSATASASGGTIPGDTSFQFAYTRVDADRGETLPSPAAVLTTPARMAAPAFPPVAVADYASGSLRAATYYYGRTWVDGGGGETPMGAIATVDVEIGHPNARVLLSALASGAPVGAAGWRLYRARGGEDFHYLASGAGGTIIDDGNLCADCSTRPPEFNTTASYNKITITIPAQEAGVAEWRLYGSVTPGVWDLFSLVGSGLGSGSAAVVLTSFTPTRGRPPHTSRALRGAVQINPDTDLLDWHWKRPVANVGALPGSGNASGDARVTLDDGRIAVWLNGAWGSLGGVQQPVVGIVHASGSAAIPDASGAADGTIDIPILMPSGGYVEDLDISVRISHTYMGDLGLELIAPDGTSVTLASGWGGNSSAGYGSGSARTLFTDEADRAEIDGVPPYLGRFRPDGLLSAFRGRQALGTWRLRITDVEEPDVGTLVAASVTFTTLRQRDGHTFNIMGPLASGGSIPPFFVAMNPLGSGKVVKVRHLLGSGSATIAVRRNGVALPSFGGVSVGGVAASAHGDDVIAQDDVIALFVTSVSGAPRDLSFTIHFEKAPPP